MVFPTPHALPRPAPHPHGVAVSPSEPWLKGGNPGVFSPKIGKGDPREDLHLKSLFQRESVKIYRKHLETMCSYHQIFRGFLWIVPSETKPGWYLLMSQNKMVKVWPTHSRVSPILQLLILEPFSKNIHLSLGIMSSLHSYEFTHLPQSVSYSLSTATWQSTNP